MSMKDTAIHDAQTVLREKGFRVTNARVQLLLLLRSIGKPLSIQEILQQWKNAPNQATVYRILSDLSDAGILKRVATHAHTSAFEYTPDKPHHHHAVCTICGAIEDIEHCFVDSVQNNVVKDLHLFTSLDSHSLEFFGRCTACTTQK